MNKIPLLGNPYQGRSTISSAQRAINIYAEDNGPSPQSPFPFTAYHTPGSLLFTSAIVPTGSNGKVRGVYRTTAGTAYAVVGPTVYAVSSNGGLSYVGSIADAPNQVYMADNGLAVVLVDGSKNGYAIDMATNDFGSIIDPSFLGADFVQYLDTFFIFNNPGTNQFYISLSLVNFNLLTAGTSFDPLDIAAKSGSADPIAAIVVLHQNLWLVGTLTTEIWIGTGAADFFFQQVQGAYIDHGCAAQYSIATQDVLVFFLQEDLQGNCLVLQGQGYDVTEISTPRIVSEFRAYSTVADAIGFCFQLEDHSYYALVFPTANKGWLYDLTTSAKLGFPCWYEWNSIDAQGNLIRPRANCVMFFNNLNLIGDYANGNILALDINTNTDVDFPDCDFQRGAGGDTNLIYLEHAALRNRLSDVIGLGEWSFEIIRSWNEDFTAGNPAKPAVRVYVEGMLLIRGCKVGVAIGDGNYFKSNAKGNYGDAYESAKTAAFRRCAKDFGVGLQCFSKDWCEAWKQKYKNFERPEKSK